METKLDAGDVVQALGALAQKTRLAAYRMLVQAGPEGLPAYEVAGRLALPPATVSFHLSQLTRAGLLQSRPQGRFVIYSADFERMNGLLHFLADNCCGGRPCGPRAYAQPDGLVAQAAAGGNPA
jgi:DNA-binding transcriptional ArsR family regulator